MSWAPRAAVVRVLGPLAETGGTGTAGSGFFVAGADRPLVATCAHVVDLARPGLTGKIEIEARPDVAGSRVRCTARVDPQLLRAVDREDVALLRLDGPVPPGCPILTLAPLLDDRRRHRTWGYPRVKAKDGLGAEVTGLAPAVDSGIEALSARSEEVSHGFSGAPVWDDDADVVIGMVMSIIGPDADPGRRQKNNFFVRPTQVLWQMAPGLRGDERNPYRGLDIFTEREADVYFGRDAAIAELLDRLANHDLVVIVGPSGSGKSSLAAAGLEKGLIGTPIAGLSELPRGRFRIGSAPTADLHAAAQALAGGATRLSADGADETHSDGLIATARHPPQELADLIAELLPGGAIRVADQFERVFTEVTEPAVRQHAVDTLLALHGSGILIVVTLRADFYGHALATPRLGPAVDSGQVTVLPMTQSELHDAVVGPALTRHRPLEKGLVEQLASDVAGRPGDLPLLQLTLTELWDRDAPSGLLRIDTYRAIGAHGTGGEELRVRGVVARLADRSLARLDPADRRRARQVFLNLLGTPAVGPAGGGWTSRRVRTTAWDRETQVVAERLVADRLLTASREPLTNKPTVEVAHEALVDAWPWLRRLAAEHADFVHWYQEDLGPWLQRWEQAGCPDELLLRGAALVAARQWLDTNAELLAGAAEAFIRAAIDHHEKEEEQRRQDADRERDRVHAISHAESLRLASDARQAASVAPESAVLVAWEALLRDHNELSESVFRENLELLPAPFRLLRGPHGRIVAAGFVNDTTVFAGETRGRLTFWNLDGDMVAQVNTYIGGDMHSDVAVAAPPSGGYVMTCDGEVLCRHDLTGGALTLTLPHLPDGIDRHHLQLAVANTGVCLVRLGARGWLVDIGDEAMAVRVMYQFGKNPAANRPSDHSVDAPLQSYTYSEPYNALLSAAGDIIVTEGRDGIRIWDDRGNLVGASTAFGVASAILLPNGTILTGAMSGRGELWDRDGRSLGVIRDAADNLDLFMKDTDQSGRRVLSTVNRAGTIEIRDFAGRVIQSLIGHDDHVWAAVFSSDGTRIATGGNDQTVRVWDATTGHEELRLHGHSTTVNYVAFRPGDPTTLLSAAQNGEIRLWQLETGPLPSVPVHSEPVAVLCAAADGCLLSSDRQTTTVSRAPGASEHLPGGLRAVESLRGEGRTWTLTFDGRTWRLFALAAGSAVERGRLDWSDDGKQLGDKAVITSDGRHVVIARGEQARLWSVDDGQVHDVVGSTPNREDSSFRRLVGLGMRPDGTKVIAAAKHGTAWIWSTIGEPCASFRAVSSGWPDPLTALAVDPLGEVIAFGGRNEIRLWDWDGEEVAKLHPRGYKVKLLAYSPSGRRLFSIADTPSGPSVAELWDRRGNRVAHLDDVQVSGLTAPVFASNGEYFMLPGSTFVAIMDMDGRRLGTISGRERTSITQAVGSPNSELVAALFSDGLVRTWSYATRSRTSSNYVSGGTAIAFSIDGRALVVGTATGNLLWYPLDVTDLFFVCASRLNRAFSAEELERYDISNPRLNEEFLRSLEP